MLSKQYYFSHPYEKSFLHFHGPNLLANENDDISTLTEIDLYDQPVPDLYIAILFSIIMAIQILIGEYLHWKVFLILRKENTVYKLISQLNLIYQMIHWPLVFMMITATSLVYPLNEILSPWFCSFVQPIISFLLLSISSHSFITASMRYVFIVHSEKTNRLGKESVKRMFLVIFVFLPFLVILWKEIDGSDLHFISFFNKCKGKHDDVFLIETSTTNVLKKSFCAMEAYDENDPIAYILALLKQIFCAASTITMMIMASNLIEGIIYFKLFSYMIR